MRTTQEMLLILADAARVERDNATTRLHFDASALEGWELACYLHGQQAAYEHAAQMIRDERVS